MTNSETILGEMITPDAPVADQRQSSEAAQEVQSKESYLDMLVGDGKKFGDVEALAKAKLDADLHIKKLEEEAKARQAKETNYDLILAKLEEKQRQPVVNNDHTAGVDVKNNDLDLDRLLDEKLSKREQKILADNNVTATWIALTEQYGNPETAKAVVQDMIKSKPYMKDVINKLGQTDPTAALNEILAFKAPSAIGNRAVNPMANISGIQQPTMAMVTWKEANQVRKTDLKRYDSQEFQKAIDASIAHYKSKGLDYFKS